MQYKHQLPKYSNDIKTLSFLINKVAAKQLFMAELDELEIKYNDVSEFDGDCNVFKLFVFICGQIKSQNGVFCATTSAVFNSEIGDENEIRDNFNHLLYANLTFCNDDFTHVSLTPKGAKLAMFLSVHLVKNIKLHLRFVFANDIKEIKAQVEQEVRAEELNVYQGKIERLKAQGLIATSSVI